MNPYLEQDDAWHDFHKSFCPACSAALKPHLSPDYYSKLEPHVYMHEPTAEERRLGSVVDIERESFIEIRQRETHQLVTVVELLSRPNKTPGTDRDEYLGTRNRLIHSGVNLVEIDLLRGGLRPPIEAIPDCDYCIMVARAEEWPRVGLWPLRLRDPLPVIPIPLRSSDPNAKIDLKALLDRIYDAAGYEEYLYTGQPDPPLSDEDATWAGQVLSGAGLGPEHARH